MGEWKEVKLGDFAEINMGQSPKSEFYNTERKGLPFLQGNRTFGVRYPYFDTYCSKPKKVAEKGEILFSVRAPVGDINIANEKICIGRGLASLKAKNNNNDYLYYLLHYLKIIIINNESGSVFGAVNKTILSNINFNLPPLPEQKAIASVLSSLDDKIDLLHRQSKTLEQMAETLFRQWFVEEADEGWEEWPLKSLCNVITKGTTPTSLKRKFVEVGINFIKVNCIDDNGNFLYDKFNFIDEETHNLVLKRSILQEGDLLYSIAGTIGRIAEVTEDVLPANTNQALAILRINKNIINPYYIKYSLKNPNVTFELHSKIVHAVQPNLSLGEIGSILIPLPDIETKKKFNAIINPIEEKIKINTTKIRTLEKLRDTLLPKLMSGEVRVAIDE
jgi:type I restriction enzyme S subunit